MPKGIYERIGLRERFESRVDRRGPNECWPWTGGVSSAGYGSLQVEGKPRGAHAVAFFLEHGRWPEPCCCHRCDNKPCCNPAHLFEGTYADNMADMVAKGRARGGRPTGSRTRPALIRRGSATNRAKLSELDIPVIRALVRWSGFSMSSVATEYGVGKTTIRAVLSRQSWSHV